MASASVEPRGGFEFSESSTLLSASVYSIPAPDVFVLGSTCVVLVDWLRRRSGMSL
jgi:hypothetical protein